MHVLCILIYSLAALQADFEDPFLGPLTEPTNNHLFSFFLSPNQLAVNNITGQNVQFWYPSDNMLSQQ
jgi:hypothetical protein